jgi:hypothetical protein
MRIKYIIEDCVTVSRSSETKIRVHYQVDKHRTGIGAIPIEGIRKIERADILVALITEVNPNIVYELAIRNMLRPGTILIVRDRGLLPIYTEGFAHIDYNDERDSPVYAAMAMIKADLTETLAWDRLSSDDIPDSLRTIIETSDQRMVFELQCALEQLEREPPKLPYWTAEVVRDLDPGRVLSSWQSYVPYAILRIKWLKRDESGNCDPAQMDGEPVVASGNEGFKELINREEELPSPDSVNPLTLPRMITLINQYMTKSDIDAFKEDHERFYKEIILRDNYGLASVPIRFRSEERQHPKCHGRTYTQTLVARRTVGNKAYPHSVYLLIAYLEEPTPNVKSGLPSPV